MTRRLGWWTRRVGMYVLLTAIALVFVGPFLILLSAALKPSGQAVFSFPPDIIPRPPVLTWAKEAWTAIPFPRYLLNSILLVAVMVPVYILVSALCAYPLAQMVFRGRSLIFFAILATMFMPGEVMLLPRFLVVSQIGMADSYLGVILPGLLSAFGIFLLRQTFAGVPREVVDAARTDGCHELRIFWHVMLPAARPTLAILGVFGFISVWNSFIWPMVVLKDSSLYPISLGIAYLAGITGTDVRSLAAGTIISILPVVVFFMIMQRHVLEGMRGAVKS
ncbi:carbohydrate ABC transporter permease [Nonomuraea sp. 3-1Str]|uniref:carbohydrate ABC transporter permease n=1 Tax=Nonomuraea sp. 3-1Str TaxID=2929801 RepID=UPI0028617974|nr:carbohydrate ABC transporter permease [Nonomuraea sp. 3-1Str]MDR8414016.1 carbohydrate ABC transporter permease [Nonomuraea sp. 3-1Str]